MSGRVVRLGEASELITKGTTPTTLGMSFAAEGVPFIRVQNLKDKTVHHQADPLFINAETHRELNRSIILPRDLLISIAGTIGRVAIVPDDAPEMNCNQAVAIIRPKPNIHRRYLLHWLSSSEAINQITQGQVTGTISNLSLAQVRSLQIPLPPLDEQRRIAAILDKADALRQKRKRAIALLDSMTQAIFLEMFGDPIENAKKYPVRPLIDLVDSKRGISYGVVQRGDDNEDGVSVLRIKDIVSGTITGKNLKMTSREISNRYKRTILNGQEIVISIRGTVGRCAIVPDTLKGSNVSREIAVIPTIDKKLNEFLLSLLRTGAAQKRIKDDVKGVAQSGINLSDLRELPVIHPPLQDIERFLRARIRSSRLEAAAQLFSIQSELFFTSLQSRAFSGELSL